MITKENLGVCFWFLSIIIRNEIAFLYYKSMQILPPIDLKCNVNNSSPFKPCQLRYYFLSYIINSKKNTFMLNLIIYYKSQTFTKDIYYVMALPFDHILHFIISKRSTHKNSAFQD